VHASEPQMADVCDGKAAVSVSDTPGKFRPGKVRSLIAASETSGLQ
jgi:hypothetical protein